MEKTKKRGPFTETAAALPWSGEPMSERVVRLCSRYLEDAVSKAARSLVANMEKPDINFTVEMLSAANDSPVERMERFVRAAEHVEAFTRDRLHQFKYVGKHVDTAPADLIFKFFESRTDSLLQQLSSEEISIGVREGLITTDLSGNLGASDLLLVLDPSQPGSIHSWLSNFQLVTRKMFCAERLISSIRTGRTQWRETFGHDVEQPFDLERIHPGQIRRLMMAMHDITRTEGKTLIDLAGIPIGAKVLDLGGASAPLARFVLEKIGADGTYRVGDLPAGIPLYKEIHCDKEGFLDDRIQWLGCDFLEGDTSLILGGESSIKKFDVIVLSWILHDWPDSIAEAILKKCSNAIATGGRIVLLEGVLPEDGPTPLALLDLLMMIQTGGRERKLSDFEHLLRSTSFKLVKVAKGIGRRHVLTAEQVGERHF